MEVERVLDRDQLEPRICRNLRSKLPQRRRSTFPPLRSSSFNSNVSGVSRVLSSFGGEASGRRGTSTDSQSSGGVSSARKRQLDELGDSDRGLKKVSRFSSAQKDHEFGQNVEISETSCCESSTVVDFGERSSMLLGASSVLRNSEAAGRSEASESIARSGISCTNQNSPAKSVEFSSNLRSNVEENRNLVDCDDDDVFSVTCAVESRQKTDKTTHRAGNREPKIESSLSTVKTVPAVDEKLKINNYDSELACPEQLSDNDVSDYSSSQDDSSSDLQSEIFSDSSQYYYSYSSFESGSEFSEKSFEDAPPSATFSLLLLYREQFSRSSNAPAGKSIKRTDINEYKSVEGFDDMEDAASYLFLRVRERKQVYLRNYGEEYSASIMEQRSRIVYWIIEQSRRKNLQKETTFLAVNLLDRFLSIGSFQYKRNFQIAGIACLTLATRIEENQPHNSVCQNTFHVGINSYSRFEVVAMEWLVQEVLNFQCVLPTTYNFLWLYLKASRADADDKVNKRATELAALALMDNEHLGFWPSTVAAAIVILASLEDAPSQRVIKTHVRTQDDDLPKCIHSLQWLVKYLC